MEHVNSGCHVMLSPNLQMWSGEETPCSLVAKDSLWFS
jgi:hypothetical protein